LHIAIKLGVRRLDARGDSQLVIDQVMKNSHCRDRKMEAYYDEVRRLEDKFYGLELNHVARRYNKTADELAKIALGRSTVPSNVFSRDIYQPSVKQNDAPHPRRPRPSPRYPRPPRVRPYASRERAEWGYAKPKLADPVPGISPPRRAAPRQGRSSATGSARQVVRFTG
jgi:hypothetical protein